jgi:uncharacterized membrane protein
MVPAADIFIALRWLIALYLCSTLGMLLFIKSDAYGILRYSFGKAFGVIGVAAITWLLSIFKIMPFTPKTILIVLALGYAIVLFLRWNQIIASFKKQWRSYLVIEIVFILLFILGAVIRSAAPKAEGIEKFMDAAILSNLIRHGTGAPVDTWYAPDMINYYYFGHWIITLLAKMSSSAIGYAFNLGFATSLAITGTSIFCLGRQLSKKYIGGFLALFLALFASNLHPFVSLLSQAHNYFFFSSGRFIEQVINEYPLYSIILGDLHAHMLSLMITTALYGLIILVVVEKSFKTQLYLTGVTGVLTGLLAATNSFDVIAGGLVFGLALLWLLWRKKLTLKNTVILAVCFTILFAIILQIFMTHFSPAIGGISIALFKTPLLHMFWQFGAMAILIIVSLFIVYKRKLKLSDRKNVEIATLLIVAGLILVLIPQFIYFKDIYFFQNPPFYRANTVFKIWYAAWPLLAIGASVLSVIAVKDFKKKYMKAAGSLFVVTVCLIAGYGTFKGVETLKDQQPNTLDGISYLSTAEPDKLAVVKWANKNITGQPLVAQAPGESYSQQSWFSSYTGLPSILGWRSHEWGWRYSQNEWNLIGQRSDSLKSLYESITAAGLKQTALKLNINYILVGPDERTAYLVNDNVFNKTFGPPVYKNSLYQLFRTD